MNTEVFDAVIAQQIKRCQETLAVKGTEYARADRLSNFKRVAALEKCTPEHALRGMLSKHVVSIYDMIDDLDKTVVHPLYAWDEKIGDAINYLLILRAMLQHHDVSNLKP